MVHVRDPTAQQYQREVEPLCKLGDVYSKRGQQTGEGEDFVKAAALYNAAIARSKDEVLNGNIVTAIIEVEKSFLKCTLDICHNVSLENTEKHKKQLKEMRDQIKLEMETIDQQLDPYVHDEDDPRVKEIEAKRAQAVRQLFENIAQQRKEFISLLVEECIGLMGPPPCKYALIGLGSQATGLVTPYSDLEFAILVEEESEECLEYFRNLTHYLHLKVVNLGETILPALGIKSLNDFYSENPLDSWYFDSVTPRGFAFDGSMPKASKTPLGRQGTENKPPSELIHTPSNMASILQNDATLYLKKGYHLATILRNPCLIAGDQALIDTYMDFTAEILQADGGKMAQQLAQETQGENIKRYKEKHAARLIDVKKDLYRFPAVAVDCLALSSGIVPTTVLETIEEIENLQVISPNNAHHLTVLTSISAELRLRTYIANGGQKENLSALVSMEAVLHGKESSSQINDEEQTTALMAVFHLPNEKQLFRYFYSSVPLKDSLSKLSGKGLTLHSVSNFYDSSPNVQGKMYFQLCKYSLAISYFDKALKKLEGTETEEIAQLHLNLGLACHHLGDYSEAISYYEQALEMQRSIYGQTEAHPNIASSLTSLGVAWGDLADYRKATAYLEQVLEMYRSIHGEGTAHQETAKTLNNLGLAFTSLGDHRKAIGYHEEALEMYRSVHGQTVDHADTARALNILGRTWEELSDHRKATKYLEQALQMRKRIYGDNTAHPDIAISLNNLGMAYENLGNYATSVSYHEQSLAMRRSIYGQTAETPHIARSLHNLGTVCCSQGNYSKAISYSEQALKMRRSIYGQDTAHHDLVPSLNSMGRVYQCLGDHRKAISFYEEALQMMKILCGQNKEHPRIAILLRNIGATWCVAGDPRKATGYLEEALQMFRSIYGQDKAHRYIAMSLNSLGTAWRQLDDARKAIGYHEQALQMYRSVFGEDSAHPSIAESLMNLEMARSSLHDSS
ncbi:uncharacterized protein [Branchiostoma lanceolatum]|uniref:uncharacterized protein n=1 Tax=Branchiostoma lanceolatum TaxID=7740 RepID=UPI00345186AC